MTAQRPNQVHLQGIQSHRAKSRHANAIQGKSTQLHGQIARTNNQSHRSDNQITAL